MRHPKVICVCALIFAASPFGLRAQSQLGTGAISGTIQDASGQAVQSATVTVTNTGMGMTRTVSTTGAGDFNIPVLPTGNYTLTAEKTGFTKIEQNNLTVTVGSTVTLKLKLQVGTVATQVDVSADAPLVDSTQTEEVSLINRLEIDNLPINGRRYDQFALLAPGVTRDGRFGLLSYRGISGIFNNFQIEGLDDNQALFSEARGRTRIASSISANAIEQFQVEKSNFLPEYGRSLGGGINTVVRSGSNALHADGFYYFRNHGLSAADPLSKATGAVKPYEQRQQLGGSIGGSIIRDKLFYFVNYDQQIRPFPLLTLDSSNILNSTAGLPANPTAADLAALAAGKQKMLSTLPGGAAGNTLTRSFNQQSPLVKIDWFIDSKNAFSSTYNYMRAHNVNGIQTSLFYNGTGSNGSDDVRIHSYNARLTTSISPSLINEFRSQWGRDFEYEFSNTTGPNVNVGGNFTYGVATYLQRPAYPDERRLQFVDNFSVIRGSHSFKFGGEINRAYDILNNPALFNGAFTYSGPYALGLDLLNPTGPNHYTRFQQKFGLPGTEFGTIDFAGYAQDQWKIRRNVTINYGIRYDYEKLPAPQYPNPAIPESQKLNSDTSNIGPRLGVAYDIFSNGKTIVRGGYGIVYGRTSNGMIYNALLQTGFADPSKGTISLTFQPTDPGAPHYPNLYTGSVSATVPPGVYRLASDFQRPRVQETNVGIEQQLTRNLSIAVSYVHSYGDRLPLTIDANLPAPQFTRTYQLPNGTTFTVPFSAGPLSNPNLARPNPAFGSITVNESIGKTWYNAMFVEVKRRFAGGFQGGISYTLAKAENLAGADSGGGAGAEGPFGGGSLNNQFNLNSNRGIAPTDQRHRAVLNGVWDEPFGRGSDSWANALIRNYRFSSIVTLESGRPYGAYLNTANIPFTGTDGLQYNGFGGIYGQNGDTALPTIPRNSVYGDANYRVDLRVARLFRATEKLTVEVFAEGFNIFNHSNLNGFNNTIYNVVSSSAATSINTPVQLTPAISSGILTYGLPNADGSQPDGTNARRFQLAMRLRF